MSKAAVWAVARELKIDMNNLDFLRDVLIYKPEKSRLCNHSSAKAWRLKMEVEPGKLEWVYLGYGDKIVIKKLRLLVERSPLIVIEQVKPGRSRTSGLYMAKLRERPRGYLNWAGESKWLGYTRKTLRHEPDANLPRSKRRKSLPSTA